MTTIQSLIDKYSSRSEGLTAISADEVLRDLNELGKKYVRHAVVSMPTLTTSNDPNWNEVKDEISRLESVGWELVQIIVEERKMIFKNFHITKP